MICWLRIRPTAEKVPLRWEKKENKGSLECSQTTDWLNKNNARTYVWALYFIVWCNTEIFSRKECLNWASDFIWFHEDLDGGGVTAVSFSLVCWAASVAPGMTPILRIMFPYKDVSLRNRNQHSLHFNLMTYNSSIMQQLPSLNDGKSFASSIVKVETFHRLPRIETEKKMTPTRYNSNNILLT